MLYKGISTSRMKESIFVGFNHSQVYSLQFFLHMSIFVLLKIYHLVFNLEDLGHSTLMIWFLGSTPIHGQSLVHSIIFKIMSPPQLLYILVILGFLPT